MRRSAAARFRAPAIRSWRVRACVLLAGAAVMLLLPVAVSGHGASAGPPPTDAVSIALAWHVDLPVIVALLGAGVLYLAAARSTSRAHPKNPWPVRRTAAFLSALVAAGLALLSPFDTLSDDLLSVHMIQHLLLVAVTAPLIAASGIGTLALRAAPAGIRKRFILPALHSRLVALVTFPVVGWVGFVGVMWGTHLSTLYNAALLDDAVHAVEHGLYVSAALLFWYPLLSPDPIRLRLHPAAKLAALIAQLPPMSFLAVTLLNASAPLYSAYQGRSEVFGIGQLADQQLAGGLMWITGDLALLVPAAFVFRAWVRHEEGEATRVDARLDRARRSLASKES